MGRHFVFFLSLSITIIIDVYNNKTLCNHWIKYSYTIQTSKMTKRKIIFVHRDKDTTNNTISTLYKRMLSFHFFIISQFQLHKKKVGPWQNRLIIVEHGNFSRRNLQIELFLYILNDWFCSTVILYVWKQFNLLRRLVSHFIHENELFCWNRQNKFIVWINKLLTFKSL